VSYNLEDQDIYWKRLNGYYMGESVVYSAGGEKRSVAYLAAVEEVMKQNNLGTYDFSKMRTFVNTTISGSRMISHRYHLGKHNGDGVIPGFPGVVFADDVFYTSTFEKDGSIQSVAIQDQYGQEIIVSDNVTTVHPIEGRARMGIVPSGDTTQTSYCLDENCDQMVQNNDFFITNPETGKRTIKMFLRRTLTSVDKDTWMSELNKALNDFNIPSPDSPFNHVPGFDGPFFVKPFPSTADSAPECHTLVCPTEDDWKQRDPALGTSPFVEPAGILTEGFIVSITIASVITACILFYYFHRRAMEAEMRRVKDAVIKSIAKSINITTSRAVSRIELENMFKKIDADGNGKLSKDEIKSLVHNAGVANLSDKDYDVLFNSVDIDGNGTLDFAEFCAFFTYFKVDNGDKFNEIM